MRVKSINHVSLVVDNLEKCRDFYTNVLGLEELPAFKFDYPVQFYKIGDHQQLHLTEWEDATSFRAHLCIEVDDFTEAFRRFKALDIIDTRPWGRVRKLQGGAMQMFIRDPSGNLIEISHPDATTVDASIFADELVESVEVYVSGRNDARGTRGDKASLYNF